MNTVAVVFRPRFMARLSVALLNASVFVLRLRFYPSDSGRFLFTTPSVPGHPTRLGPRNAGRRVRQPVLRAASNVEQNLQNDVDFQQARSSSQWKPTGAGSNKEADDAGYGVRENH